jgi:hypothetical protein
MLIAAGCEVAGLGMLTTLFISAALPDFNSA